MEQALSPVEQVASLPEKNRLELISGMSENQQQILLHQWRGWLARPDQVAPDGDWSTWLMLSGRGAGKTRAGSEWVRENVCGKTPLSAGRSRRVALVAETAADARDVMVEGDSGLLAIHPPDYRPEYQPSKRRLVWQNGAMATLYNAREPDQLRGPQHDLAWSDELAKWRYAQATWDMLQFGLRLGTNPQHLVSTTPKPIGIVKTLVKEALSGSDVVVTRTSTYSNKANLSAKFIKNIIDRYEGTRLGRQELHGDVLDDVLGALWTGAMLDEKRMDKPPCDLRRIVVAVDPACKDHEDADEHGITVAGLGEDGRGYLLDDVTTKGSPQKWARRTVSAFDQHDADKVVVEVNQGGDMVKAVLQAVRPTLPIKMVHATRGKHVRAEPIAALYEQGRISHCGNFGALEDQMIQMTASGYEGDDSPDRLDSVVWAFTELFNDLIRDRKSPIIPAILPATL